MELEKNKKRSLRRKEEVKKLHKALYIADSFSTMTEEWKLQWARKHANNLKGCSCWMCCSPRKSGELTQQEKKVSQRDRYSTDAD